MNGSNSNTSGANVANVGFWPKAVLPAVVNLLGGIVASLKGLQAGQQLPASVDFSSFEGSDKLTDGVMEEIARRLVVTIEKEQAGNVLFQPLAPDDHTKAWWQTDPITNLPVGRLQQWDTTQAKWVPVDTSANVYVPPKRRNGLMFSPAGASTQNLPFEDIGTDDYRITLTPTTFSGTSNTWLPAPVTFPSPFGFVVSNKTSNLVSIAFFGIPTGGITWEVDVEDRQNTAA